MDKFFGLINIVIFLLYNINDAIGAESTENTIENMISNFSSQSHTLKQKNNLLNILSKKQNALFLIIPALLAVFYVLVKCVKSLNNKTRRLGEKNECGSDGSDSEEDGEGEDRDDRPSPAAIRAPRFNAVHHSAWVAALLAAQFTGPFIAMAVAISVFGLLVILRFRDQMIVDWDDEFHFGDESNDKDEEETRRNTHD